MKNVETSVKLSLLQNVFDIYLIIDVKMPQFKGKSLTIPGSHTIVDNDKSKILISYSETANEEIDATSQTQKNFPVYLGTIEGEATNLDLDTLADCVAATAGNSDPILSKYTVTVEITGDDDRKTIIHITEDADIDMRIAD